MARGTRVPWCVIATALALLISPRPLAAQRLLNEFRQAFEAVVRPARTRAVVLRAGIPTMTIDNRDPVSGNAIVAFAGSDWRPVPTGGRMPQFEEFLYPGEVLELVRITYADNTIDLRMVSADPHKSLRGFSKRVVTTFRMTVPLGRDEVADAQKVPAVLTMVASALRVFGDEIEARRFASTFPR